MNNDGEPDFGLCFPTAQGGSDSDRSACARGVLGGVCLTYSGERAGLWRYGTWNFMTVVTAYMQTQGTTSGAFFDKDTMNTLFHGEGFLEVRRRSEGRGAHAFRGRAPGAVRLRCFQPGLPRSRASEAIRTYAETLKYTMNADGSPREPGQQAWDGVSLMGSVLPNQVSGRCALIYDWMASGTSSVLEGPWFGISYVNNQVRVGLAIHTRRFRAVAQGSWVQVRQWTFVASSLVSDLHERARVKRRCARRSSGRAMCRTRRRRSSSRARRSSARTRPRSGTSW